MTGLERLLHLSNHWRWQEGMAPLRQLDSSSAMPVAAVAEWLLIHGCDIYQDVRPIGDNA